MPQTVKDPTVFSLAVELVRAFVRSVRVQRFEEPLFVLDEMRRKPCASLRRSPVFLEALDAVACELRRDAQESNGGRQSRFLNPPMPRKAKAVQGGRSLQVLMSSTESLQSKAARKAAKQSQLSPQPSQASRAARNESGRNCNVQSAKRKPLSGSSASSKKRS
jgi:hypothetical protein